MKIAILSFFSGHLERGVENWTHQLATRLAQKHELVVFQNGPASPSRKYQIISTNFKVNWKSRDSRGTLARMAFVDYWSRLIGWVTVKIMPTLFKKNFDIVIPTNGGWQVALVRLLTWVRGGKMVIVGHSGKGWDERNNIFSFPDVFIGLSRFARNWAKRINPLIKTAYIPNGIDLKNFSPKGKKAQLKLERPLILTVAAPEGGKRLVLAIEAVSKLAKSSLLVLGGGYEEEKLRRLGEKLLGKRFWMKKVPFEEMPKYYRSCDIFTIPSAAFYSFEMVLLEAMATNLPVVANDDPIRREIVGKAGILVDPEDIDSYKEALKRALEADWGTKPRRQAEKFSWNKIAKKYEKLFIDLVK